MKLIIRLLLNALAVFIIAYFLSGVTVNSYTDAIVVALVLAILNLFVKPVLIILTLPVTIVTLGLFLLIINALIVLLASNLLGGFEVSGWFTAIIFSILLSLLQSLLHGLLSDKEK